MIDQQFVRFLRVTFKRCLSRRWVGPTISLVGVLIGLIVLLVTSANYWRSGSWREIDEGRYLADKNLRGPRVKFIVVAGQVRDGWAQAIPEITNPFDFDLKIASLEVVTPDVKLAMTSPETKNTANGRPDPSSGARILIFNEAVGHPKYGGGWSKDLWIAPFDRTQTIIVRFDIREAAYPYRDWSREAASVIY